VYCGSVNQRGLKSLEPGFARHGWVLQAIAARPIHVDYQRYALQKMGIDRLALCEAASFFKPHGAKILLSAGTCLTLDVMSPKNEHLGGFIMPGFAMSLGAMHCNTDALPKLNSSLLIKQLQQSGDLHFGLNTEDAMVQGFFWQVTGMVEVIQKQLFADYGEKAEILVTGGYGEILAKFLKAGYDPDLIMRGLKNLVLF
jgi:type III pantothenate kinase